MLPNAPSIKPATITSRQPFATKDGKKNMIWAASRLRTCIYLQRFTSPNLSVGKRILRASQPCCTRLAAPLCKCILAIQSSPAQDLGVLPHAARLFQTQHFSGAVYQDQKWQENDTRDTIAALSSGAGRSGVAVIRLSGPTAGA